MKLHPLLKRSIRNAERQGAATYAGMTFVEVLEDLANYLEGRRTPPLIVRAMPRLRRRWTF
jgi:hypothetical protein